MVQPSLERSRAELMLGYGPGADPALVNGWTRDRPDVAGRSVVELREAVARVAAVARGDLAGGEGVLDLQAGPQYQEAPVPPASVARPASLFVLGLLVGGLVGRRRRR